MQRKVFYRHLLVVIAILMMIGSALISFFWVHASEQVIMMSRAEIQELDTTIRNLWENTNRMDRNTDTLVMVSLLANKGDVEAAKLLHYYISPNGKQPSTHQKSIVDIVKTNNLERDNIINKINDMYIQRIERQEDIIQRESQDTLYKNIAFFMQLIGLVLVILTRELPDA